MTSRASRSSWTGAVGDRDRAGLRAREVEQLIDELVHARRGLARHVDVAELAIGERAGVAREHDVERARDRGQRRAQLVRHDLRELGAPARDVGGVAEIAQDDDRADQAPRPRAAA